MAEAGFEAVDVNFCGTVYGKPKNYDEAFSMLSSMSGTAHAVHTGYSVIRCSDGTEISDTETTYVTFDELSASDVENIIKGDSPYDKAGAYAIQGSAAPYICGITGCYLNVVGFPLFFLWIFDVSQNENKSLCFARL